MNCSSASANLLTFDQAQENILSVVMPIKEHDAILLPLACNRILAQAIISPLNVPSFDNAAMDGYAVRLRDFADSDTDVVLPIAGKAYAGHPFNAPWPDASCVRIMTGAPVPKGADAVVMQEDTETTPQGIKFKTQPKAKQNIRYIGEEICRGEVILDVGTKLSATTLPLIASLGIDSVSVFRKLRVALFSTGDELQQIGLPLKDGQIYDTNSLTIKIMLEKLGCDIIDLGVIADDPMHIKRAFIEADETADVVISSGGVSVGEADYTKETLDSLGQVSFWKIAMKPGKPFAFGKLKNALFCGLPGNPVSAAVTFYHLVQPLLMKLSGYSQWQPPMRFRVKTLDDLKKTPGRIDFQRGRLSTNKLGDLEVSTTGHQGSHIFSSFHQGNCFIVLDQNQRSVKAGEYVTVMPFNTLLQD